MAIFKRVKTVVCVAAFLGAACDSLPDLSSIPVLSALPFFERETKTEQETRPAPSHEHVSAAEILGLPTFSEVAETGGSADIGVGSDVADVIDVAHPLAVELQLNEEDVIDSALLARRMRLPSIVRRMQADSINAALRQPISTEPPWVYYLEDVTGNFADRNDLKIAMTLALYFKEDNLIPEITFKDRALSLSASNILNRFEFGTLTIQRLQTELLSGFNTILEQGNLDSVVVDIRVRI